MKTLIDISAYQYNEEAVNKLKAVSVHHAKAAYNTQPSINKDRYHQQEADETESIVKRYAVKCLVSKEYDKGMKEFVYLDKDDKIVMVLHDAVPRFGVGVV